MKPTNVNNEILSIFSTQNITNRYLVTLNDLVDNPSSYAEFIALLNFAEDGDEIQVEINNSGGNLLTALQIRNSMLNCKANVVTHLNVEASSAASIIFLSGHSYVVGKYASLLAHEGMFGLMAKPSDVRKHVDFYNKQLDRVVKDIYSEILTPSEIEAVLNGLELILDDVELMKRLNNRPRQKDEFSDMLNTDLCEMFKVKLGEYVGKKLTQANVETISQELADEVVEMLTSEVEE